MTEAKSPREIAEPLLVALAKHVGAHGWDRFRMLAEIEQAILSYAAERERLLADADWLIDNIVTQLREMYLASPIGPVCDAAIERHRVRSRPATEGKREDD